MPDWGVLYTKLGYSFKNVALLEQAMSHRSFTAPNNERLEFLGDALLNFLIGEEVYRQYPSMTEGELTRTRASLVNGITLAQLAQNFNLGEYLRLGYGEQKSGGANRNSILADACEALIGAIYLDSDLETLRQVLLKWYANHLMLFEAPKDAKTRLQETLQAAKLPLPRYEVVKISGKQHEQTFCVRCVVKGFDKVAEGEGGSRRQAEQNAAAKLLEQLRMRGN